MEQGRRTDILNFPRTRSTYGYEDRVRQALLILALHEASRRLHAKLVIKLKPQLGGKPEWAIAQNKAKLAYGLAQLTSSEKEYKWPRSRRCIQGEQSNHWYEWDIGSEVVSTIWGGSPPKEEYHSVDAETKALLQHLLVMHKRHNLVGRWKSRELDYEDYRTFDSNPDQWLMQHDGSPVILSYGREGVSVSFIEPVGLMVRPLKNLKQSKGAKK